LTDHIRLPFATAIQLEMLRRITGHSEEELMILAVQNLTSLALFQAARTATFSVDDLFNTLVPVAGKLAAAEVTPTGEAMPPVPTKATHRPEERITRDVLADLADEPAPYGLAPAVVYTLTEDGYWENRTDYRYLDGTNPNLTLVAYDDEVDCAVAFWTGESP